MTNSSISLPTWRVMPRMMAPAAISSSIAPPAPLKAVGLRKPSISEMLVCVESRVEPVDLLGQHRVAEAIDHMRELGDDRRVQWWCRSHREPGRR